MKPSPLSPNAVPGTTATFSSCRKRVRKLIAGHAEFLDTGEHIKRAVRLKAGQPHLCKGMQQIASALVVLFAHVPLHRHRRFSAPLPPHTGWS